MFVEADGSIRYRDPNRLERRWVMSHKGPATIFRHGYSPWAGIDGGEHSCGLLAGPPCGSDEKGA